jgi:ribose/xylose/arabinose/galactoside ABC-type transport system permease subunit
MTQSRASLRVVLVRWGPLLVPLGVLAVLFVLNPTLRHPATWERMSRNWAHVALLAIGLTPIIITGGIDLSVGSIVGLSAVVAGFLWRDGGWPLEVALLSSLLAGLAAGVLNGSLVLAGISPLVVTLATLAVFRGLAYGLSGAQSVDNFPAGLRQWWEGSFLGVPHPLGLVLIPFALAYVFLHHTWMGRMVFALGDNPAWPTCSSSARPQRHRAKTTSCRPSPLSSWAACGLPEARGISPARCSESSPWPPCFREWFPFRGAGGPWPRGSCSWGSPSPTKG